jgi:hypothetical protein
MEYPQRQRDEAVRTGTFGAVASLGRVDCVNAIREPQFFSHGRITYCVPGIPPEFRNLTAASYPCVRFGAELIVNKIPTAILALALFFLNQPN